MCAGAEKTWLEKKNRNSKMKRKWISLEQPARRLLLRRRRKPFGFLGSRLTKLKSERKTRIWVSLTHFLFEKTWWVGEWVRESYYPLLLLNYLHIMLWPLAPVKSFPTWLRLIVICLLVILELLDQIGDNSKISLFAFSAVCLAGCHPEHGGCDRPGQCR